MAYPKQKNKLNHIINTLIGDVEFIKWKYKNHKQKKQEIIGNLEPKDLRIWTFFNYHKYTTLSSILANIYHKLSGNQNALLANIIAFGATSLLIKALHKSKYGKYIFIMGGITYLGSTLLQEQFNYDSVLKMYNSFSNALSVASVTSYFLCSNDSEINKIKQQIYSKNTKYNHF